MSDPGNDGGEDPTPYQLRIREEIVEAARAMLSGTLSFVEGSRTVARRYNDAGIPHLDPDIVGFVMVESDTDALPLGDVRRHWQVEALDKLQPEIDQAEARARRELTGACKRLIDRFGN
jgi:hypothetical protein